MDAKVDLRKQIAATPRGQAYPIGIATQQLAVGNIRTNGGTQARAELSEETLTEYTQATQDGAQFPPIIVYYDGETYWLADGFHRVEVARRGNRATILAEIRPGTRRDAVLFACGANDTHGLRRSRADKRRAIETLLRDDEWKEWSDSEIARRCQVDHKTVAVARADLYPGNSQDSRTVERGGTTYQMTPAQPAQRKPTLSDEEQQHAKKLRSLLKGLSAWHESIQPDVIKDAYTHLCKIRGGALRDTLKAEIEAAEETMQADVAPTEPDQIPQMAEWWDIKARWAALGWELATRGDEHYRITPSAGGVGIDNMTWYSVVSRLEAQERKAIEAQVTMPAEPQPTPDLTPLSEELEARAKRVGLNVWISPDHNGYTTAQNPGAANYTDHASLDALTDFIASREAPSFWQAIDAHHPSAHLWTFQRPDLLRAACGLTMQNRLPSGATDASHCSSCVRATWVEDVAPAAEHTPLDLPPALASWRWSTNAKTGHSFLMHPMGGAIFTTRHYPDPQDAIREAQRWVLSQPQRPNAPAGWVWRDDNSLRCLADNVIIRPRMTHANTVAEAEQHDRIRAQMVAERDPAHIEALEEQIESADTIPEASQQAVADQQLPIAAYVAAMDLIGKLRGAVVAGARADAIERCVQLKALLETAEE